MKMKMVEPLRELFSAHWAHLQYELLEVCPRRIVNEAKGVSRVVLRHQWEPAATIEWE